MVVGKVKSQVFFGSRRKVDNPGCPSAVFDPSVVGLSVQQETAVLHE
jgi:hypothetical protein